MRASDLLAAEKGFVPIKVSHFSGKEADNGK